MRECVRNHLAHLVGERHHSDDSDSDLNSLILKDPVAGAFKMWMLDSSIRPLQQNG
jgi:hypothetical protein